MSVSIQVLDNDEKPVANARVFVSWKSGGYSDRTTNSSGIADLDASPGTASEITVNGQRVMGTIWLENGNTEVRYRR